VGEVVPTKIRSKAYSLFVTTNWTANLVVALFTLSAIDGLGGVKEGMADQDAYKAGQQKVSTHLVVEGTDAQPVEKLLYMIMMPALGGARALGLSVSEDGGHESSSESIRESSAVL
jgi:hypothetical protein